jgi:hypothetical protein
MVGRTDDVSIPLEFGAYGESRFNQGAVIAGEELTTGSEEAAVARDGA